MDGNLQVMPPAKITELIHLNERGWPGSVFEIKGISNALHQWHYTNTWPQQDGPPYPTLPTRIPQKIYIQLQN